MDPMELPIACNLTDPEFQKRRATLLETFRGVVLETKELSDGFAGPDGTKDFLQNLFSAA